MLSPRCGRGSETTCSHLCIIPVYLTHLAQKPGTCPASDKYVAFLWKRGGFLPSGLQASVLEHEVIKFHLHWSLILGHDFQVEEGLVF